MSKIISYECYDFEGREGAGKLCDNANVTKGFAPPCPSGGSPCFIHRRNPLKSYLFKIVIQSCYSSFGRSGSGDLTIVFSKFLCQAR